MLEVKKNKITLMEKNARKIIDIFIIKHVDIRTAIILAGFIIDIDCVRLTDMECQNIAIKLSIFIQNNKNLVCLSSNKALT